MAVQIRYERDQGVHFRPGVIPYDALRDKTFSVFCLHHAGSRAGKFGAGHFDDGDERFG